ncbi:MerR family transcriptional regulator [Pendulispora brunnea]|uniref:MerR family transcriptional regulator n=1 Tax=Pendulispora brunnea TaxID=2905690 RepID=A0ABZ2K087_9BACT
MRTKPLQLKVGELAARAGVSVRALHHYDEIGLLRPGHTSSGHRIYDDASVERLLQIKALRQLGFSLEDIIQSFHDRDFSLRQALTLRLERLREEMVSHRILLNRLENLVRHIDADETLSTESIFETMEAMMNVESYFTPEQLEELRQRREALGEEGLKQSQEDWRVLVDEVRGEIAKGTDPASPRAQELGARWAALVQAFTGGNPGIAAAVRKMWFSEGHKNTPGIDVTAVREAGDYIVKVNAAKKT